MKESAMPYLALNPVLRTVSYNAVSHNDSCDSLRSLYLQKVLMLGRRFESYNIAFDVSQNRPNESMSRNIVRKDRL